MPDRKPSAKIARSRFAIVQVPSWIWGGRPEGFGAEANWDMVATGARNHEYRIRLGECRRGRPGRLVELKKLGHRRNVDSPGTFGPLRGLARTDPRIELDQESISRELRALAEDADGLAPALFHSVMATSSSPAEGLPELVRRILKDQLLPVFPHAAAWLLEVDPALNLRFAFSRVMTSVQEGNGSLESRPEGEVGRIFDSGRGLMMDTLFGLAAYLAPFFLSHSPWVLGVTAGRAGGVVMYTFGRPVAGRRGVPSAVLQLFQPGSSTDAIPEAAVSPGDLQCALRWWVRQLDTMFTEVTDPCNFRNSAGIYQPTRQLETLLTVEQVFRNVQSLLSAERDQHARRSLMFDTLDALEGLNQLTFHEMCRIGTAQRILGELEDLLPTDVGRVLLPKARASVEALERLQEGFFLQARLTDEGIRLPERKGGERVYSKGDACALWLRVVRNAGHGFGARDSNKTTRDATVLAAHDGETSPALWDLAYMYLLRMVAIPGGLRNVRGDRNLDKSGASGVDESRG